MDTQPMPPRAFRHDGSSVALAALAMAAITVFVLAATTVHALRPGLDAIAAQLSVYLVGPWGWLLQAGYAALAVGILVLAIGLYRVPPVASRSAAPLLLFAIAAPSLVVTREEIEQFLDALGKTLAKGLPRLLGKFVKDRVKAQW